MNSYLRQHVMPKALSDKETYDLADAKARLITQEEIPKYRDIFDLLGPKGACIILYVTKLPKGQVFGHWCCVFMAPWAPKTISYFDPYGMIPDYTMRYMSPEAIQEYGNQPVLSQMLRDAVQHGYTTVYSTSPLQKKEKGNAICGRLTSLRLQFKHLDNEQFADLMNSYNTKGLSSDELAALVTSFVD